MQMETFFLRPRISKQIVNKSTVIYLKNTMQLLNCFVRLCACHIHARSPGSLFSLVSFCHLSLVTCFPKILWMSSFLMWYAYVREWVSGANRQKWWSGQFHFVLFVTRCWFIVFFVHGNSQQLMEEQKAKLCETLFRSLTCSRSVSVRTNIFGRLSI